MIGSQRSETAQWVQSYHPSPNQPSPIAYFEFAITHMIIPYLTYCILLSLPLFRPLGEAGLGRAMVNHRYLTPAIPPSPILLPPFYLSVCGQRVSAGKHFYAPAHVHQSATAELLRHRPCSEPPFTFIVNGDIERLEPLPARTTLPMQQDRRA